MFKHPTRCLDAAAHFLIRKELFNSKYPQLQVAKDFAVAEKKLHLTVSGRKYDPGKKHLRKDIPQMVKQQLLNHQLLKNSCKVSLSLNNSHKVSPSLNNSHKVKPLLIPNRNMSHHNSAAMMMSHFQMHFPHPQRLFEMKDPKSIPKKPKYSLRPKILHI